MYQVQDGFAWGSGSIGLLFLFIILLIVVLTWRRCPSCGPQHETQLIQKSGVYVEESPPSEAEEGEGHQPGRGVAEWGVQNSFVTKYMKYTKEA